MVPINVYIQRLIVEGTVADFALQKSRQAEVVRQRRFLISLLISQGYFRNDIAEAVGVSPSIVTSVAREYRLALRYRTPIRQAEQINLIEKDDSAKMLYDENADSPDRQEEDPLLEKYLSNADKLASTVSFLHTDAERKQYKAALVSAMVWAAKHPSSRCEL